MAQGELEDLADQGQQKAADRQQGAAAGAQGQQTAGVAGTIDWTNPTATAEFFGGLVQGSKGVTKRPLVLEKLNVPERTEYTVERITQPIDYFRGETYLKGTKLPAGTTTVSSYTEDEDGNREEQAYDDYINSGFRENKNPNIENAVVTLAGGDFEKFDPIFQSAAIEASYRQAAGEDVTMMDVLNGWQKNGLPKGLSGGGGGGGGSQAFTDVNTRVDLTNEGEARRIVNNALAGALGREATKAEMNAFRKALNMNERENPVVTTTTGVRSASGSTSETTSEGGFDYTDYADRFAKSQEGYAEYQTATTYLDAFIGALESDSRVI